MSTLRGFLGQVGKGGGEACSRPNERGWDRMSRKTKAAPLGKLRGTEWKIEVPLLISYGSCLFVFTSGQVWVLRSP